MATTRCKLLVRHLARRRINPHTAGRAPGERDGFATHRRSSWEDSLHTAIDTERTLSRLLPEQRILLLLIYGLELSVSDAAWLLNTSARTIGRHVTKAEHRFDVISDAED